MEIKWEVLKHYQRNLIKSSNKKQQQFLKQNIAKQIFMTSNIRII